jgi:hypothetical protein
MAAISIVPSKPVVGTEANSSAYWFRFFVELRKIIGTNRNGIAKIPMARLLEQIGKIYGLDSSFYQAARSTLLKCFQSVLPADDFKAFTNPKTTPTMLTVNALAGRTVYDMKEPSLDALTLAKLWDSLFSTTTILQGAHEVYYANKILEVDRFYSPDYSVLNQWSYNVAEWNRQKKIGENKWLKDIELNKTESVRRESSIERCFITHFLSKLKISDIFHIQTETFYIVLADPEFYLMSDFKPLQSAAKLKISNQAKMDAKIALEDAMWAPEDTKMAMDDTKESSTPTWKPALSMFGIPVIPLDFKPAKPSSGGTGSYTLYKGTEPYMAGFDISRRPIMQQISPYRRVGGFGHVPFPHITYKRPLGVATNAGGFKNIRR